MFKFSIKTIAIGLLGLFALPSCERGELLNSEADIIEVILPENMKVGTPVISNTKVRIPKMATNEEDAKELEKQIKQLTPKFILTPGATISDKDVEKDFSIPQRYTVTSEDGIYTKEYEISFFDIFNKTEFSFEHFETYSKTSPYYVFFEMDDKHGKQEVWSSGNAGFSITAMGKPGEAYPTATTPNGRVGNGAKLVTRDTGIGASLGMPIAAGNLFLGTFDMSKAIGKPLEATQFGVATVMNSPKELTLWCKYQAGPEYKDKEGNVLNIIDRPEIYAVLYEPQTDEKGNPIKLNGHNIKTADNIISIAELSATQAEEIRVDNVDNADYVYVTIPFISKKEFNPDKQEQGIYHIALVFSSSAKGSLFEGAVGSTLYVDEVKFIND